ncbi:hypothetical protein B0H14DRAFT_3511827 [Mycena olivaceomarginata]|nr:hypothetical protein B0H14DRAFT_3511827 [Mycena olivaceomarginata]
MTDIVVPYLKKTKECLLLPPSQKSLVDMDVWAAWKSCRAKQWDLAYECLTSLEAREALQNIKVTDRQFWDELESGTIRAREKHNGKFSDNLDPISTSPLDDGELVDGCEISSRRVKATMQSAMNSEPLSSENNSAETLNDVESLRVNPEFAGFTSNATMAVVNYPKVNASHLSRPSRDRFMIEDHVLASKLVKKAISFVPMAPQDPLDGTLIDLILDVDLNPDVDLDVWWTVSKSGPCVAQYSCKCGFLCFTYTYYYNGVTCPGTASTTGSTTTTTPTTITGSKTSTTTTSTFATKV